MNHRNSENLDFLGLCLIWNTWDMLKKTKVLAYWKEFLCNPSNHCNPTKWHKKSSSEMMGRNTIWTVDWSANFVPWKDYLQFCFLIGLLFGLGAIPLIIVSRLWWAFESDNSWINFRREISFKCNLLLFCLSKIKLKRTMIVKRL